MRMLIIESDQDLNDLLSKSLRREGYAVDAVIAADEGEYLTGIFPYDLVIIGSTIPAGKQTEICRRLRQKKIESVILLVTSPENPGERIKGLDNGADECLSQPVVMEELLARTRSLLKRRHGIQTSKLEAGDLTMDTSTREVWKGNQRIKLTPKEFAILEYLMHHPDTIINRDILEQHIWDMDAEISSNLVEVYIRRIRQKINKEGKDNLIETSRGIGYRLKVLPSTSPRETVIL